LGVVEIHPTLIQGTFRQILFTVSGKSFDPDKDETDSVQVFWTTSDVTHSVEASLSVIPANQRKTYPISKLVAGNITDTANGIDKESTKYWFFAALSRNTSGRVMGYAYSDTVISNANLLYDSCTFKDSKSACPSEVGIFGVKDGPWAGRFETRVVLTQPTESGLVRVPKFVTATNTSLYNLDLTSPVPMFSLDASVPGLGTDTSKQQLNWQVQLYFSPEVLAGLDLFLLPKDSAAGSATLVPDWSVVSLGGGKYSINFKSTVNGPQTYAFGKLLAAPGTVTQSDNDPPVYDFDIARDSLEYSVPIKVKGAGFKTGNPLLLISTVPAGGTVYPPTGSKAVPTVISKDYPVKTLAASAGYSKMPDSLRNARSSLKSSLQIWSSTSAAMSSTSSGAIRVLRACAV